MDNSVAPVTTQKGREDADTISIAHHNPSKGGWAAAIFIIFVEMAERFAYYGLGGNLMNYLTDVHGEPNATAAKNVNTWFGVSALLPLLGAFIADSYLGRFKTILVSSVIYFMGMILLVLAVSVIHGHKSVFFVALYTLAIAEGGHKPCVQTFAADQFDDSNPEERAAKSSFFNWWFLGIVTGACAAILVIIYIQENVGWAAGFGVLAGILAMALILFLVGFNKYRIDKKSIKGSPYTKVVQVIVAAARKWRVSETRDGCGVCYEDDGGQPQSKGRIRQRTNKLRFLEKAMIIDDIDSSSKCRNPWRLCSQNQVEQVKMVISLIPVWISCIMFFAVQEQIHTFMTKQGGTVNRSIGPHFLIPPAALQSLVGVAILITIPIYDRIFVPLARKFTGIPSGITMLQRIGIGLFLSILNMSVAALVETKRLNIARENGLMDSPKTALPMSLWWLVPQYMICGISDAFSVVGLQELFYDQMPEEMRSMGAAAYISIVGVGNFLNSAIISAVQNINSRNGGQKWIGNNLNRSHLDYFYWTMAGLSALNFCGYLWIAKAYVYKNVAQEEPQEEKELMGFYDLPPEKMKSQDHV
ncbi:protein NRT1/ PTR FAMILY 5.4-like [Mangifera indica]|uniref:protein NRT1/ PTR FAMILY 5.4-like n=1 Tax=Mangifera indica TaxID=29780 RepID=UPI001CF9D1E6|nr:protein NRT1/ PTR FAMILY 5.4-like [Mangifera indica]